MRYRSSERGAIIVMVAVALLALTLISGIVVDYGVLWAARNQAQNAADAAALAGALARVSDDPSNPPASKTSGIVFNEASAIAKNNPIWGIAPPSSSVVLDWTCPDGTTICVAADVYRDGTHGSQSIPTIFMNISGLASQRAKAHAVAWATGANGAGCLRPWFMIDKYTDANGDGHYGPGDSYATPGYKVPQDIGTFVQFHENGSPSGFGQVYVGQTSGTSGLNAAIENCGTGHYHIGEVMQTKPGASNGQKHGVDTVLGWDPTATWDPSTNTVINSCAATSSCSCGGPCPNGASISPRIMVTVLCAPTEAACDGGGPGNSTITVVNFLSFFIAGSAGGGNNYHIDAYLAGSAGENNPSGGGAPVGGAFTKIVQLIR